ncbi:MAG: glycoside hydrolase family 2 protein [Lachnospiraceae bacterium]|nr:glycoside hydrolase family 2 protein [Lachnospiraceae bacterium]
MDKQTILLSDCCRFHLGDEPDAWQAWFNDSDWEEVTLPHDWSVAHPFSRDYSSGTGYLIGGIGWYRIHIIPSAAWQGKRISITFDGIYKNSRVWCNSYYLGERPNGYISFTYDITDAFRFDTENIISVYVDHREISDSRWFTGSGITRKVTLNIEENVHPVPNGIFFTTPEVSEEMATFHVDNELVNTGTETVQLQVTNYLLSQTGNTVTKACASITLAKGETKTLHTTGSIDSPILWSPKNPYLYTLKTTICILNKASSEEYVASTISVGIRTFSFTPDKGFFLNNRPLKLKGVCVHHDAGCLGAAVLAPVWQRRLTKLKVMGCNAIRMSHNPHMPELYDLCDSMGFLVIDEAFDEWEGPKNKWSTGHNVYPPKHQGYYVDFPAWHERDLVDMIRRDRNHPCVLLWSIGNEIDYPNDPYCHPSFETMTGNNDANKPAQERQYNPYRPNAERLAVLSKHLCDIVKSTDTSHPVTLAAAFPELSSTLGFIDPLDVVGYNYKEHLYAESHAQFPDKPFLGSENGHTLNAWKAVTDNNYISGQFLWTGIDYLGEAHGWPIHGSGAGLLTLAGFEKSSYYRRQSFWATEPMVHLTTTLADEDCGEFTSVSESWNYPLGAKVLVKCYTNLSKIELFLNDKSLGIWEKSKDNDCICLQLSYEPGKLRATGIMEDSTCIAPSHTLYTTSCACQMDFHIWETSKPKSFYQIEVTLQDSNGYRVYNDNTMLYVSVENGNLLGLENGNLADITEYSATYRSAYRGQLLIYVTALDDTEPVSVHVSGEGIQSKTIELPLP